MADLYGICPAGHRHPAVNVPDDPEAVLEFRCTQMRNAPRTPDGRLDYEAMQRDTFRQTFYVQVKDLVGP